MNTSLQQLRLVSGHECSTSYAPIVRPSTALPLGRAGRRKPCHQRLGSSPFLRKQAVTRSAAKDEGAHLPGSLSGKASIPDGSGSEPKEQKGTQSAGGLPKVPWGIDKVFQVMMLWLLAYFIIGQVAVPLILTCLGVDRLELTVRSHAVLHLCLDISQLVITLSILWSCLREYRPRQLGLFPVRLKGLWILAVVLCCATFPVVDWLAHQSMGWFPSDLDATWASNLEHSLSIGDWVTNVAYFSVVSLCAPIWEEAIFRGFLLTSLVRYMPTPYAVAASSVIFAMCHFRLQTFLPLLVLGVVFSLVFIRTNNLIPPILLHSAWNMYVLVTLVLRPG